MTDVGAGERYPERSCSVCDVNARDGAGLGTVSEDQGSIGTNRKPIHVRGVTNDWSRSRSCRRGAAHELKLETVEVTLGGAAEENDKIAVAVSLDICELKIVNVVNQSSQRDVVSAILGRTLGRAWTRAGALVNPERTHSSTRIARAIGVQIVIGVGRRPVIPTYPFGLVALMMDCIKTAYGELG